ncbi:CFT1 [Mytilus edulis]|uniref:CPSF1 n=1 Tax=Mytilus edulis TaxID=6550 RepID=A0A8S3Q4X9_MYTED|nr:CFT1 [Mytilus edulis]
MKVRGDGNCFYRCISLFLYGIENHHNKIRQATVKYMKEHKDRFLPLIDENFNLHMAHQSMTDGTLESWATEAEITAVGEMYDYTIFVKTKIDGAVAWIKYSPMNGAHDKERWIAIEHLQNHFNLLKFKQKKCVCKQIHLTTSNIQEQKNMVGNRKVQNDEIDWFDQTNMKDNSNKDIEPVTYRPEKEKKSIQENEVTNTSCPVINLSSKNLNTEHMSLLSKGLSFIPAQKKVNIGKVLADLTEWERRMRLKEYFYNIKEHEEVKEKSECSKTRRKNKDFTPKPGKNIWLDTYIEVVKGDVMNGLKQRKSINLTTKEENALKDILQDDDIVIRPADKGSGIVVINKEEYFKKLEEEITNNDTYSETEQNTTHQITKKVKSLVNRMKKRGINFWGNENLFDTKTSTSSKIKRQPKNPQTEQTIQNNIKLYPSIPREEGIKACKKALDTRKNKEIPTNDILQMIKLVLEGNNFRLIDRDFLQNEGVAIGSKLGKNFACTYMRQWDKALEKFKEKPLFYKRFIDDGFGIWTHGEQKLKEFMDFANSINDKIKVELSSNKTCKEECEVCDIERNEEKIILGDKTFNLKKNIHGCQLVNLIYGLHCEKCNHYVYVGETERSLNERIKEHLADIRHDRDTAVAEHFNQEDHCKEDITVQCPTTAFKSIDHVFCIQTDSPPDTERNLVIAAVNQLHVYRLNPDTEDDTGKNVSEQNQETRKKQKLECLATFSLFGNIMSLQFVKLPGANRDALLLSFSDAKLSVVEYDPSTHDLQTTSLHYFEEPALKVII